MQLSELEWAPGWELREESSTFFSHARGLNNDITIIDKKGEFAVGYWYGPTVPVSAMQVVLLAAMPPGEVYAWAQERAGG